MTKYRLDKQYIAKCPNCSLPTIENKPIKAKQTMAFQCENCGTSWRMNIDQLKEHIPQPPQHTKTYMNRQERDRYLFGHNAHHLADLILETPNLPEKSRVAFQEAKKMMEFGALEWLKGKEARTVQQLIREADIYTINLGMKKNAWDIAKKNALADSKMRHEILNEIGREPVYDLCLATFQHVCRGCDGSPAQSEEGCQLKNAFEALAIPPWDAVPECPYAYTGLLDEEVEELKRKQAAGVEIPNPIPAQMEPKVEKKKERKKR